jgi:nitroreductase
MSVYKIVLRRRSIRVFKKKRVPFAILRRLIEAGRLAPSAANLQPCEFIVVDKKEAVAKIFPALRWAGYIKPQGNPPQGKEPAAYIVVLINRSRTKKPRYAEADAAAAVENILLVAEDEGLGSCWLGAIERPKIGKILNIPKYCQVKYVIALGYPDESPRLERLKDSIKYWQDKCGRLHVPKRSLEEVWHRNVY